MARPARSFEERRAAAAARRERRAEVEDAGVIMDAAAAFLAVRPRSVEETRRRLRHLGYPGTLSDQVIDRLVEMRYLDDESFARAWVESRDRARPRGVVALRRELDTKGIDKQTIDLVLDVRAAANQEGSGTPGTEPGTLGPSEVERSAAARLLVRRKSSLRREPDTRKRRQKAYALLARNGFTPDVCHDVAGAFALDPQEGTDTDV